MRPSLTRAVEWIAANDEPGDLDERVVAEYISTQLVADVFLTPVELVAKRIVILRHSALRLARAKRAFDPSAR
jgi:hypothetical protein